MPDVQIGMHAHDYGFSLRENEAIIMDSYVRRPSGRLFCVRKEYGQWRVTQEENWFGDCIPRGIVLGNNWFCVLGGNLFDYRLFLFQRDGDQWKYRFTLDDEIVRKLRHIQLTEYDGLLVSVFADHESQGVYCRRLNEESSGWTRIASPPGPTGDTAFGDFFSVVGDTLFVYDSRAFFSPEENRLLHLTPLDCLPSFITEGRNGSIQKSTIYAWRRSGDEWVYECDFYPLLPHPTTAALREELAALTAYPDWHRLIHFSQRKIHTIHGQTYLPASDGRYYVFERNDAEEWVYSHRFDPPQYETYQAKYVSRDYGAYLILQEKYSIAFPNDQPLFDVVDSSRIEEWSPLWTQTYGSHELRKMELLQRKNDQRYISARYDGSIAGNTVLMSCNSIESYEPKHSMHRSPVWGGVSIFEIDDETGPHEVFRMETRDETGLKVIENQ